MTATFLDLMRMEQDKSKNVFKSLKKHHLSQEH